MLLGPNVRLINWLVVLVPNVVDHDSSVIQTSSQEGGRRWVPVQTHHSSGQTLILVLGESDVLEGPDQDLSCLLLGEVVASKGNGKKILVLGVPTDRSDVLLLLFVAEPPDGQQFSLLALGLLSFLPVVLVVVVLAVFLVLSDHPFHDLHAPLEGGGVPPTFLRWLLLVALLITVLFQHLLNIAVPDVPLGHFSPEVLNDGRASGSSPVVDGRVDSLNFSAPVVELVSHSLLDGFDILA